MRGAEGLGELPRSAPQACGRRAEATQGASRRPRARTTAPASNWRAPTKAETAWCPADDGAHPHARRPAALISASQAGRRRRLAAAKASTSPSMDGRRRQLRYDLMHAAGDAAAARQWMGAERGPRVRDPGRRRLLPAPETTLGKLYLFKTKARLSCRSALRAPRAGVRPGRLASAPTTSSHAERLRGGSTRTARTLRTGHSRWSWREYCGQNDVLVLNNGTAMQIGDIRAMVAIDAVAVGGGKEGDE